MRSYGPKCYPCFIKCVKFFYRESFRRNLICLFAVRNEIWVAIARYKSKLNSPGNHYFIPQIKLVY